MQDKLSSWTVQKETMKSDVAISLGLNLVPEVSTVYKVQ